MRRFFCGSVYIHVQYVPTKKNLLTYLDKTWSACFPVSMTSIFIFIYDNADDEKKKSLEDIQRKRIFIIKYWLLRQSKNNLKPKTNKMIQYFCWHLLEWKKWMETLITSLCVLNIMWW